MTSFNFKWRIYLLYFVGLSHNLVRVIWVVYVSLTSYHILCDLQGHLDIWSQCQGQCIYFLYRLNCSFITPPILDRVTSSFHLWSLKKELPLYDVKRHQTFNCGYLSYFTLDWATIWSERSGWSMLLLDHIKYHMTLNHMTYKVV